MVTQILHINNGPINAPAIRIIKPKFSGAVWILRRTKHVVHLILQHPLGLHLKSIQRKYIDYY